MTVDICGFCPMVPGLSTVLTTLHGCYFTPHKHSSRQASPASFSRWRNKGMEEINMSKHTWVTNRSTCKSSHNGRIVKSPRTDLQPTQDWTSVGYIQVTHMPPPMPAAFPFGSLGIVSEDWERTGVRGHSANTPKYFGSWQWAGGEATIQGRRLGAQSSDPLDSELLYLSSWTVRGTTLIPLGSPHTTNVCWLFIGGRVVALTFGVKGKPFFLLPSLLSPFLSFKT